MTAVAEARSRAKTAARASLPYTPLVRGIRAWILSTTGLVGACVNTYVVDEGSTDTEVTGTTNGPSTSGVDESEAGSGPASSSADGMAGATGDSGSVGSDGTGEADSATSGTQELCQECMSDDECGAEIDLCYALDEVETACLRRCGEGCPDGFECTPVVSVDGVADDQCVPTAGTCAQ